MKSGRLAVVLLLGAWAANALSAQVLSITKPPSSNGETGGGRGCALEASGPWR